MWRRIDNAIGWLSWVCSRAAIVIIVGVAFVLVVNIVMRVTTSPILGIVDVASYAMLTIIMLALPYTHRREAHIRIRLITDRFGRRTRAIIEAAAQLVTAFVTLWISQVYLAVTLHGGATAGSGLIDIPETPFRVLTMVGFGLWGLEALAGAIRALHELSRSHTTATNETPEENSLATGASG